MTVRIQIASVEPTSNNFDELHLNSVYKVKRTWDHYCCTCPAWRNQGPVNARSCKHLKTLLGEKYENARIKMKNPDGPPPKGGKAAKPKSSGKTAAKRKKRGAVDEDEDEDAPPPSKRGRKAPASKSKAEKEEEGEEEEEDGEEDEEDNGEPASLLIVSRS